MPLNNGIKATAKGCALYLPFTAIYRNEQNEKKPHDNHTGEQNQAWVAEKSAGFLGDVLNDLHCAHNGSFGGTDLLLYL